MYSQSGLLILVGAEQPVSGLNAKPTTEQTKSRDRIWPRNFSCWIPTTILGWVNPERHRVHAWINEQELVPLPTCR